MSDTIFLFSPNKRKFKIQGIPSSRLLLLFYIDESTVNRIHYTDRKSTKPVNDWYSLFSSQAKKEKIVHSTKSNQSTSITTGKINLFLNYNHISIFILGKLLLLL